MVDQFDRQLCLHGSRMACARAVPAKGDTQSAYLGSLARMQVMHVACCNMQCAYLQVSELLMELTFPSLYVEQSSRC